MTKIEQKIHVPDMEALARQLRRGLGSVGPRIALGMLTTARRRKVERHRREITGLRALHRSQLADLDQKIADARAKLRAIDSEAAS